MNFLNPGVSRQSANSFVTLSSSPSRSLSISGQITSAGPSPVDVLTGDGYRAGGCSGRHRSRNPSKIWAVIMTGFLFPRTPTGQGTLLPPPPWHYSGQLLTFEYRTDVDAIRGHLPDGVELADEDPGAVALIWADWQSCGDNLSELLDPIRAQYKEVFLVTRCKYRGETYTRCLFIWVDKDFAMMRGILQGYPKRMGSIHMTRPVSVGKAGPRLEPGGTFGATLAVNDRRIAGGRFVITKQSDNNGFVNGHPMLHNRLVPSIEIDGRDSLNELISSSVSQVEIGQTFSGDFELSLIESPAEELHLLPVREKIGGYWRDVGVTWRSGRTLKRDNL